MKRNLRGDQSSRVLTRVEKSRVAFLWKRWEALGDEIKKHPSKRLADAMAKVNAELYALGEI